MPFRGFCKELQAQILEKKKISKLTKGFELLVRKQPVWDFTPATRTAAQLSTATALCKMRSEAAPIKLEAHHAKASGWLRHFQNVFQVSPLQAIGQTLSETIAQPGLRGCHPLAAGSQNQATIGI